MIFVRVKSNFKLINGNKPTLAVVDSSTKKCLSFLFGSFLWHFIRFCIFWFGLLFTHPTWKAFLKQNFISRVVCQRLKLDNAIPEIRLSEVCSIKNNENCESLLLDEYGIVFRALWEFTTGLFSIPGHFLSGWQFIFLIHFYPAFP